MRLGGTESDWWPMLIAGVHCGFDGHGRLFGTNLKFLCVHRFHIHDSCVTGWPWMFDLLPYMSGWHCLAASRGSFGVNSRF